MESCFSIFLAWPLFAIVGYYIGQKKGINPVIATIAGAMLGPFVLGMYLLTPEGIKCPRCAEWIKQGAVFCKHCKYELTEVERMTNK
ncbi:hypothetical protein L0152_07370 [bacterium]|nr:hypothetical protein [bacterium]